MSHACVLVVLKEDENLDEVMAPYDENAAAEYLEFKDCTDEVIERVKEKGCSEAEAAEYYGYRKEGGAYGYMYNPNGYWDWFVVGGRWCQYLKLKSQVKHPELVMNKSESGEFCDACAREDFDYKGQKKAENTDALFFAVLKNGEWYGSADLGWFGTTSNENEDWAAVEARLLEECDPKDQLVIVDYHI